MQHSVSLSFAFKSFSVGVNIGGKLQWTTIPDDVLKHQVKKLMF